MEGMGEDMEDELEDDGQSELARMQKATLGDSDLAQYAITGNDKVRFTRYPYGTRHLLSLHTCDDKLNGRCCSRSGTRPLLVER